MDAYKSQMNQNYEWQQFYKLDIPQDTGVTSPEGYTVGPDPGPPYVLKAAAMQEGAAPLSTNPSAALYSSGQQNLVLLHSTAPSCDTGCVASVNKPDPRVFQVKPLYQPSVFKAPAGYVLPTTYNVVGMY
uniref:Uncharacterized protein n=1 Tax=Marseillevirus LCMAC201 TaxID=2506605 RepID=A0A481YWA0_9VIRU|nr:MAG: hypothetical protein LCMAC201_00730 [Marseillevirus LCMAC201]